MRRAEVQDWRGATVTVGILLGVQLTAMVFELAVLRSTELLTLRMVYLVLHLSALLVLLAERERRRPRVVFGTFVAMALAVIPQFWIAQEALARGGPPMPFVGIELFMVVLAAVAPGSPRLAFALFGAFTLAAIAKAVSLGARASVTEPALAIVTAAIAVGVRVSRARRVAAERYAARQRAQAEALAELAETLLVIEDLAHTPLQTIALSSVLIRARCPEAALVADRIDRAIVRLSDLRSLLEQRRSEVAVATGNRGRRHRPSLPLGRARAARRERG